MRIARDLGYHVHGEENGRLVAIRHKIKKGRSRLNARFGASWSVSPNESEVR
jgi:hypothetical protein